MPLTEYVSFPDKPRYKWKSRQMEKICPTDCPFLRNVTKREKNCKGEVIGTYSIGEAKCTGGMKPSTCFRSKEVPIDDNW